MNIVIIGDGKVGYTLAEQLSREDHDITMIEKNSFTLQRTVESLDIEGVLGNGASYKVQMEAGVNHADLLIAATSSDEINMISCLLARKLGAKHTIARIRNAEYGPQLMLLKDELGLSMVINPEQATAVEISRLISFPSAIAASSFAKGRVCVIAVRVRPESKLAGLQLCQIHQKFPVNILIGAVQREDQVIIPDGNFTLEPGDIVHVMGDQKKIALFFRDVGTISRKVKRVMIIGGSRIAYYLAKILDDMRIDVRIIEQKPERCQYLDQELPHVLVIEGDGTEQNLLSEEGVDEMDAFVALTDIDEENMIISMYASRCGVNKVIAKINRLNYLDIITDAGIDSVVSPKLITASQMIQYVRALENASGSSQVQTLYRIANNQAEILEFRVQDGTKHLGETLNDIQLRPNTLIGAIVRKHDLIIPRGSDRILAGDKVIVITCNQMYHDLADIFAD